MSREQTVIDRIENYLVDISRWYLNIHGNYRGVDGTPDIITVDDAGRLLAIEAKKAGEQPKVNQWRRMIEILTSGGRCVVAYPDIEMAQVLSGPLEIATAVGGIIGQSEFEVALTARGRTSEIILKGVA